MGKLEKQGVTNVFPISPPISPIYGEIWAKSGSGGLWGVFGGVSRRVAAIKSKHSILSILAHISFGAKFSIKGGENVREKKKLGEM